MTAEMRTVLPRLPGATHSAWEAHSAALQGAQVRRAGAGQQCGAVSPGNYARGSGEAQVTRRRDPLRGVGGGVVVAARRVNNGAPRERRQRQPDGVAPKLGSSYGTPARDAAGKKTCVVRGGEFQVTARTDGQTGARGEKHTRALHTRRGRPRACVL